jgi:hypothetical protein
MSLLWFRRSKAKEVEHVAPAPLPAAPPQPRVPLRIRGLLLLNLKPNDGLEQIETAPPLGRRDQVMAALQNAVPGMTFDGDGHGELREHDYRLMIDLGPGAVAHTAVVAAEGNAAVDLLRSIMQRARWRAYVPKAGVFVEPDALDLFVLTDELTTQRP